jgi:hypothetical protein
VRHLGSNYELWMCELVEQEDCTRLMGGLASFRLASVPYGWKFRTKSPAAARLG